MQTKLQNLSKDYFETISEFLFSELKGNESLVINLAGDATHFMRFNRAKIRQAGTVRDYEINLKLQSKDSQGSLRQCERSFTLSESMESDKDLAKTILYAMQTEVRELPVDPFTAEIDATESSEIVQKGKLLEPGAATSTIAARASEFDFTGLYSSGSLTRANATSTGARHWFETDSFLVDYSLYGDAERAYKGFYGGRDWSESQFIQELDKGKEQLAALAKTVREIKPGKYRTYLAPAANWEFSSMLNGVFGESALQQGSSPIRLIRSGEKTFSKLFSYSDNYANGDSPRFSADGELYPERIDLVKHGVLTSTLVSKRTAKEYKLKANGSGAEERVNAPELASGSLADTEILKVLGTGLYISNLHYLNWSDRTQGRVTGMTRYACFWVENGALVAPIENLRWDDTIFRVYGANLEALTAAKSIFPDTSSYGKRSVGATRCSGLLLSEMSFTL